MTKPIVLFVELKISAKNKYICEITEKLFHNNILVSIYSKNETSRIDNQLWTWKQESFIPHQIADTNNSEVTEVVVISNDPDRLLNSDAIILDDPLSFDYLNKYKLIIDFAEVFHSEKKIESRQRYKTMRESDRFNIHFTQLGAILSKQHISLN